MNYERRMEIAGELAQANFDRESDALTNKVYRWHKAYELLCDQAPQLAEKFWEDWAEKITEELADNEMLEKYECEDFLSRRRTGAFLPYETLEQRRQVIEQDCIEKETERLAEPPERDSYDD